MNSNNRVVILFTLAAVLVACSSLFLAAHIIFPPGKKLQYEVTFSVPDSENVTQVYTHQFPGLLASTTFQDRLIYCVIFGAIIGLISGLLLATLAHSTLQRILALVGLSIGCMIEYNMHSLFSIFQETFYTGKGAGPAVEMLSCSVGVMQPFALMMNLESTLMINLLLPMGSKGAYVLYAVPVLAGLAGLLIGKIRKGEPAQEQDAAASEEASVALNPGE